MIIIGYDTNRLNKSIENENIKEDKKYCEKHRKIKDRFFFLKSQRR